MSPSRMHARVRQKGAAAVEFAIVCALFLVLLIAIMELGRVLFYMNSAAEATRLGARIAVVCDLDATGIARRMNQMLHLLNPANVQVRYNPAGCDPSSCRSVTVSIAPNLRIDTFIPGFSPILLPDGFSLNMPAFTTTLQRESMSSADNELCN